MRKVLRSLLSLTIALAFVAMIRPAVAAPASQDMMLMATLSGTAEVPDPGDPDGSGSSTITMKMASSEVCWEIKVMNITMPAAAAHIHEAPEGVAGPVVVPLSPPDASGMAMGCGQVDAALMERISQNPANFYVNVHTSDFPGGAVRGQLAAGGGGGTGGGASGGTGGGTPGTLPSTGAGDGSLGLLGGLALTLLALGTGLTVVARRRASTR